MDCKEIVTIRWNVKNVVKCKECKGNEVGEGYESNAGVGAE